MVNLLKGSVWEALRFIKENNLSNIEVYVNVNGYAAYDKVDVKYLVDRLRSIFTYN
jgi:transketolase N-terminal domain/subunit